MIDILFISKALNNMLPPIIQFCYNFSSAIIFATIVQLSLSKAIFIKKSKPSKINWLLTGKFIKS